MGGSRQTQVGQSARQVFLPTGQGPDTSGGSRQGRRTSISGFTDTPIRKGYCCSPRGNHHTERGCKQELRGGTPFIKNMSLHNAGFQNKRYARELKINTRAKVGVSSLRQSRNYIEARHKCVNRWGISSMPPPKERCCTLTFLCFLGCAMKKFDQMPTMPSEKPPINREQQGLRSKNWEQNMIHVRGLQSFGVSNVRWSKQQIAIQKRTGLRQFVLQWAGFSERYIFCCHIPWFPKGDSGCTRKL